MNFKRMEHINLSCQDLEASQRFYQTLFPDWYVRAEGSYEGDRWIHLGNEQFYMSLNNAHEPAAAHRAYASAGFNHVGFVIEDAEAMRSHLQQHGIEYYTYTSPETRLRLYVTDPDGNEVEMVDYQPDYALR